MKTKLGFIFIILLYFNPIFCQSRQEVLQSIQKFADKASGQNIKSNDVFSKKEDKIGRQIVTEQQVVVNTVLGEKSEYQWVIRYTDISWNDFFDSLIYTDFKNGNLQIVEMEFKKYFKYEYFTSDTNGEKDPNTTGKLRFYILTKDKDEVSNLLSRLYDLKEKKPESLFNKEIANFSKEQTIDWLKEKLQNNIAGDQYSRSITFISIDACNLVFDYSNMVGRKYRETIPTNIASINKYNQFTYDKKISISKSYAFTLIQQEDKTTYQDKSFLGIRTNDSDLISNIAFAMKHLADYCNNRQLNISAKPAMNNIKNNKIDIPPNTDLKTNTKPLVDKVKKDIADAPKIMTLEDLNYLKEFFAKNFVKTHVSLKGYDDVYQYDYEIRFDAIIIYKKGITNNQDNLRNRYNWYYLPMTEVEILDIKNSTPFFKDEDVLRLGLINNKWITHGAEKKFIKLENSKYSTPILYIPMSINNREEWNKVKLIFNKYHKNK